MMVLRHIRPPLPATHTVVTESDDRGEDSCPIDLSNKHTALPSEVPRNLSKAPLSTHQGSSDTSWRESTLLLQGHDDNSGEEEDFSRQSQGFIPLSRIQARYHQRHEDDSEEGASQISPNPDSRTPDKVLTKRARLDCLISNLKQSKPVTRSSPDHQRSTFDESATSLRSLPPEPPPQFNILGMDRFRIRATSEDDDEPCNLACPKQRPPVIPDGNLFDPWKMKGSPMSPTEAAKAYGIDPENYQQHMMQLQLTTAAMMGDNGGLIKSIQGCPPWVLLYYSQVFHNIQTQQLLRQYAMQNNNSTSTVIPEEKSPSTPRSTLGASGYHCQSPLSPASLSEGQVGADSDGGSVGHLTPGSVNGKRAPRAMTGRHVRTGTGASPATLQTLRLKIEERQRLKAQQHRSGQSGALQSVSKTRNGTTTLNNHTLKLQHKKSKK